MKVILLIIFLLLNLEVNALEFSIIGACKEKPLISKEIVLNPNSNLGEISLNFFKAENINFVGDQSFIKSIYNSPVNEELIEQIGPHSFIVYGWCVSIDQQIPDIPIKEIYLNSNHKNIVWFFGYSIYQENQWINHCLPSFKLFENKFCQ